MSSRLRRICLLAALLIPLFGLTGCGMFRAGQKGGLLYRMLEDDGSGLPWYWNSTSKNINQSLDG